MQNDLKQILEFLHFAEKAKYTLRHGWLSNGVQEDIAQHSWRMNLIAISIVPLMSIEVDITKVLKIITIHDLVEVITGDMPIHIHHNSAEKKEEKKNAEEKEMSEIIKLLPDTLGTEFRILWDELENLASKEAILVKAIDKIEGCLQHNESDLKTWHKDEYYINLTAADKYVYIDKILEEFNNMVHAESKAKFKENGINIEDIMQQQK